MKVIVTGGSGKLGRACIRHLLAAGHQVINADTVAPREETCPFVKVDITDMGQVSELLAGMDWDHRRGVDAVIHLAAIPMPGKQPNAEVFRINTLSTYNVFEAARRLGIRNIVWASSETLLGLPYEVMPPYLPVDEECPARPETAYSLSKLMGEELAMQFCRWDPELKIIGLRLSNVMDPEEYAHFPAFERNPESRKFNLWGYIDARDGAQAITRALESPLKGAHTFVIANDDTVMQRPTRELADEFFPGVPYRGPRSGNATLLSIEKARRLLGYEPQFSWRRRASS
jgi:nucleoside-diphosphate-sugar epimerase